MAKIAVIKPDHLGDFVLSLPGYRAILGAFGQFDLYAAPSNRFMSHYLLRAENVNFFPLQLPHLIKGGAQPSCADELRQICQSHQLVLYLRDDGALDALAAAYPRRFYAIKPQQVAHETWLQRDFLQPWTGRYSRSELMHPPAITWPDTLRQLGLVLSAGFTANKLPLSFWLEFAHQITQKKNIGLTIIAGPQEQAEAGIFQRLLGRREVRVVIGGENLEVFRAQISHCDAAVGVDSGTLHLISLFIPVLGIFTSSPWRRYAPFGRHNRVLAANVPCSPCIQFSRSAFNGCVTRECAGLIRATDVVAWLLSSANHDVALGPGVSAIIGASHIDGNGG